MALVTTLAGAAPGQPEGVEDLSALSASLEERVALRTAELSAAKERVEVALSVLASTLDSTVDGILVVDPAGRIVVHNRRFAEMWAMPEDVLIAGDDARALAWAAGQLQDPDHFMSQVRELYDDLDAESRDELVLKDGRVFERDAKPHRLGGQSIGRVWSFRDVTDRKRSEQALQQLADHDELTSLINRRCFQEELIRGIAAATRSGKDLAAVVLDIDNFKYINDTLGHRAGDELIQSVANLLREGLRGTEVLARLGGDEFALLLSQTDAQDAERVASSVLEAVRGHVVIVGGQRVSMTVSIGVALLSESGVTDAGVVDGGQLMVDADLAMYEAKMGGRNRVSIFTAASARDARLRARYTWVDRIRDALEHGGFVLQAQPILDLATGDVSQHELLLRLRGDDGALIPPGAFLPSAERHDLVQAIDRWVVRAAIGLIDEHAQAGNALRLEVNLSGKSIGDHELTGLIERELARTQIDPTSLIFEVTETAAIANMDAARAFADTLTQLGCRFALDDFGTGFGSFYYLKHLPVSYLKIDGEFIEGLATSETDQLMVQAIVTIAQGLGKATIAEFVEDAQTQRLLQEYGVDFAQGYHVGRPVDVSELWLSVPATARRASPSR